MVADIQGKLKIIVMIMDEMKRTINWVYRQSFLFLLLLFKP